MDPIGAIKIHKDSTFAMLRAAQRPGWHPSYMEPAGLAQPDQHPVGRMRDLEVTGDPQPISEPLDALPAILMRRDPPFDLKYVISTYILEQTEARGNLAAGDTGIAVPLSRRDHWTAERLRPKLGDCGILFAGIDVIGDCLTEANVTHPTCSRELDRAHGPDIAGQLMDPTGEQLQP